MLIGNRWLENARLKTLNIDGIVLANWVVLAGNITTGLTEKGILKGLSTFGATNANTILQIKVLVDGSPIHQGDFRVSTDAATVENNNVQPTCMPMPELDIPPNSTVEIMTRVQAGGVVALFFDLHMIAYQVKEFEQAVPPVCMVTDLAAKQPV